MEELSRPKDALFARDTLTAKVISGGGAMSPILEKATWMKSYFPSLYKRKLREMGPAAECPHPPTNKAARIMNSWLFLTVGSYVALKAWILNRTLAKQGRSGAIFYTKIGPGQLEYASRRYVELGKMYQALEKR